MKDNIPVYHADDIFEDMDQEIVDLVMEGLNDVSYGDASFTLIPGKEAYELITMAQIEISNRRGESVGVDMPPDLMEEGIFFALRG